MSLYTNFHITVFDSLYQVHNQSVSMYEVIPWIGVLQKLESTSLSRNSKFSMNPKIQYHIYINLPLVPVWSQMNPVHTFKPHFLNFFFSRLCLVSSYVFDSGLFELLFQKNPCIGSKKILFLIQRQNIEEGQSTFL